MVKAMRGLPWHGHSLIAPSFLPKPSAPSSTPPLGWRRVSAELSTLGNFRAKQPYPNLPARSSRGNTMEISDANMKTNAELADEIERGLVGSDYVYFKPHYAEWQQIIAALRRQPSSDQVLVPREP